MPESETCSTILLVFKWKKKGINIDFQMSCIVIWSSREKGEALTIKNEHILVISLALGFVYLFTQQMIEWPGPVLGARAMTCCHPLEAPSVIVTEGRKAWKPSVCPVLHGTPGIQAWRLRGTHLRGFRRKVSPMIFEDGRGCDFTERWLGAGRGELQA